MKSTSREHPAVQLADQMLKGTRRQLPAQRTMEGRVDSEAKDLGSNLPPTTC